MSPRLATAAAATALLLAAPAAAQDLFKGGNWSAMAADRRASGVGDAITVVVQQAAEASNTTQNATRKSTDVSGGLNAGSISESGQLSFGGGYTGRGEVRRSERLVAQLSVTIEQVLPNGDYRIVGEQRLHVNGEKTLIAVRGRIRPEDIRSDNSVLSSRIADAQINYDGKGFVSRSARPGLLNRIFSLLGLG
ncbi:flagellar basal body L-ring protein FlgH [Sphingomonas sp. NPDC092331]|jgi:flagellar L-ring protein FlgH|uniref:flagellar basal body L-ring protein FlgH n=1 Tax=unclassified Sphingomonas TaxID=196159 RepID=UPI0029EB42CF|nr:flagellar basal body L-ring protein FlgH [Pseudomonadota bacterium]